MKPNDKINFQALAWSVTATCYASWLSLLSLLEHNDKINFQALAWSIAATCYASWLSLLSLVEHNIPINCPGVSLVSFSGLLDNKHVFLKTKNKGISS